MKIDYLDHLVLTVKNINTSITFYTGVLGMDEVTFGDNRKALRFGNQKINLHKKGQELVPSAGFPKCGSADICFITKTAIEQVQLELENKGVIIEDGIVSKTGALGPIKSLYFRDPDKNLIEISTYE